uniref:Uncharacterized protein n=1 Tax=Rangifer tarandus platyrhynchus TaxID=3082113 RepID=A0ACB0FB51_RANTA|nr:unnamed protein product [Rangifer tarandus platyrhynchus]
MRARRQRQEFCRSKRALHTKGSAFNSTQPSGCPGHRVKSINSTQPSGCPGHRVKSITLASAPLLHADASLLPEH